MELTHLKDLEGIKTVGFTGTQNGLNMRQFTFLDGVLFALKEQGASVARHGDCEGADAQFHELARKHGYWIVIHPPTNDAKRAFCRGDTILPVKPYLKRNADIVRGSDILLAGPKSLHEKARGSGTWATIREARRRGKTYFILKP